MDAKTSKTKASRSEELRYDSVVAVNPGVYEVVLAGQDGKEAAKTSLVALNRESYVVLRTGVEAEQGPSYPQELMIYPKSDPASLQNGARKASWAIALALALVASMIAL